MVNAAGIHGPPAADGVDGSKKSSKKASKKKSKGHRGQKSKSDYQLRKRENRERLARSMGNSKNTLAPVSHTEEVDEAIAPHSPCRAAKTLDGSETNGVGLIVSVQFHMLTPH